MTLIEHLDELRARLLYSLIALLAISMVAYFFRDQIMYLLTRPLRWDLSITTGQMEALLQGWRQLLQSSGAFDPDQIETSLSLLKRLMLQFGGLIFIHPTEAFFGYIKLSFFTGLLLGMPIVLYQIWQFIVPALFPNEKRWAGYGFIWGAVLFYAGALFCFFVILPLAVQVLVGMGGPYVQAAFTFGNYISFAMWFMLGFGMSFELPLVIFLLTKAGVVTSAYLREKWRHAIVLIVAASAVLTPTPDAFTLLTMAIPLGLLYGISLILARFAERGQTAQIAVQKGS